MKTLSIIVLALFLCPLAMALEIKLSPNFGEMDSMNLYYTPLPAGGNSISGTLASSKTRKKLSIPNICEPEGGDPTAGSIITKSSSESHGDILAIICKYSINHSGLGINGTLYQARVYENQSGTIKELKYLEDNLSGYEGSSEDGSKSYYFYGDTFITSQKLDLILENNAEDSLNIAHAITIQRLKNNDMGAIIDYLTSDFIEKLITSFPLKSENAALYNDIGFALAETGKTQKALDILLPIEKVTPQRAPLFLNIADAYWPAEKSKAKLYYRRYIELMTLKNKTALIPARVHQRLKSEH